MERFKIQDNAGNRYIVYANSRYEAKQKAQLAALGSVIYIIE